MLDPFSALGKAGHSAADELLRGMIELCSAAPSQGPGGQESTLDWRDNTLARQIADGRTVLHMIDWMLQGVNERQVRPVGEHDDEATPRIATVGLDEAHDRGVRAGLRTSSLVQSISVLVDLIRKNNSDFVEQQMLSWARRKEEEATEREILEADGAELVGAQGGGESDEDDRGPSLVDLSAMLSIVATRLSGFQDLIRSPRSLVSGEQDHHLMLTDMCDPARAYRDIGWCRDAAYLGTIPYLRVLRRAASLLQYESRQSTEYGPILVRLGGVSCSGLESRGRSSRGSGWTTA